MMIGEFNQAGKIEFYTVKAKPFDLSRLQAAMFVDRPDLWQKKPKRRARATPSGQQRLFEEGE